MYINFCMFYMKWFYGSVLLLFPVDDLLTALSEISLNIMALERSAHVYLLSSVCQKHRLGTEMVPLFCLYYCRPCDSQHHCDCVGCYCGRSGHDRLYFLQVCRSTWNMRITELLSVWQILIKCLDSLQKVMNLHKWFWPHHIMAYIVVR